jgi:phosphatidate cytidylyltransferase
MLATRFSSAIVLGLIVLPLVWVGGPLFSVGIVALSVLAVWELAKMMSSVGHRPQMPLMFGLAILLPLEAHLRNVLPLLPSVQSEILVLAIALSLAAQVFRRDAKRPLVDWALSLAGVLYVALPLSYFILLRALPDGDRWVLLVLACVWMCDSFAYLAGTTFGRHGFFTHVSPKKTVEGAAGGILAGSVTAFLAVPFLSVPLAVALPLGFVISLAATFGDLAESLIKRQLKAKDSGAIIPGHGGFLDRLDSMIFTVIVVYIYAAWIAPWLR